MNQVTYRLILAFSIFFGLSAEAVKMKDLTVRQMMTCKMVLENAKSAMDDVYDLLDLKKNKNCLNKINTAIQSPELVEDLSFGQSVAEVCFSPKHSIEGCRSMKESIAAIKKEESSLNRNISNLHKLADDAFGKCPKMGGEMKDIDLKRLRAQLKKGHSRVSRMLKPQKGLISQASAFYYRTLLRFSHNFGREELKACENALSRTRESMENLYSSYNLQSEDNCRADLNRGLTDSLAHTNAGTPEKMMFTKDAGFRDQIVKNCFSPKKEYKQPPSCRTLHEAKHMAEVSGEIVKTKIKYLELIKDSQERKDNCPEMKGKAQNTLQGFRKMINQGLAKINKNRWLFKELGLNHCGPSEQPSYSAKITQGHN